ncbi:hypothetical protein CK203_063981 [Vitis vinifera]|uniref:Retrovirus-related Pol polyprotein from transposon RE1 n=1 Tax=Vitis vinifera TaxID=29760 RepID=A0A438G8V3_VITVI|nr:hypothetical protein CK203_063981 [Vitis vinifera]
MAIIVSTISKKQFSAGVCGWFQTHTQQDLPDNTLNPTYGIWFRKDQALLGCIPSSIIETLSPILDYLQTAKALADQLAAAGKPVDDQDLISYIIDGLQLVFNPFITSYNFASRDKELTIDEFNAELLSYEALIDSQCVYLASNTTHFALTTSRHPPTELAAMVAESNATYEHQVWYADSGANAHITSEAKTLTLQQPFTGQDTDCRFCLDNNCYFIIAGFDFTVKENQTGKMLLHRQVENGLYPIGGSKSLQNKLLCLMATIGITTSMDHWHSRLGDSSKFVLESLARIKNLLALYEQCLIQSGMHAAMGQEFDALMENDLLDRTKMIGAKPLSSPTMSGSKLSVEEGGLLQDATECGQIVDWAGSPDNRKSKADMVCFLARISYLGVPRNKIWSLDPVKKLSAVALASNPMFHARTKHVQFSSFSSSGYFFKGYHGIRACLAFLIFFTMPSSTQSSKLQLPSSTPNLASLQSLKDALPIKLDRNNYILWKTRMENVFFTNGFEEFIGRTKPCPSKELPTGDINPEFVQWRRFDRMVLS